MENITYTAKDYEPASFYGPSGNAILFLYILPSDSSSHKVIILFTPSEMMETAIEIDNLIRTTTSY